jgi:hypothetical protein
MKQLMGVLQALVWMAAFVALVLYGNASSIAQPPETLHNAVTTNYAIEFETVDQGEMSYCRCGDSCFTGVDMLIKESITWAAFWEEHTMGMEPRPPLPEVDFGAEMVLVAILGFQPTGGGPGIEVLEITVDSRSLNVLIEDDETQGLVPVITNPYHIVRLQTLGMPSVVFEHQTP